MLGAASVLVVHARLWVSFLLVEVFHTSDDWRGGTTGRISSGQTLTTLESKPPPTIKNRNKEKKDPNTDAAAGFVRSVVVVGGGINHHRGLTMG